MLVYNLVCICDPISFSIYRACANIKVKGHEVTRREHTFFSSDFKDENSTNCENNPSADLIGKNVQFAFMLLRKHVTDFLECW